MSLITSERLSLKSGVFSVDVENIAISLIDPSKGRTDGASLC